MTNFYYLDISLEFGLEHELNPPQIIAAYFKRKITDCVQDLFGKTASSIDIDILKYEETKRRAIIRVPKSFYVKLRSSLTLCGKYEGCSCVFKIHKASPLLLALQAESRNYQH